MIGLFLEIGTKGFTWGVKANFLILYFNECGTRYDTARAPKVGRYKNGMPFYGLEVVS